MPKFDLDSALVRKLTRLLQDLGLTEIEYEAEGRRIRVARNLSAPAAPAAPAPPGGTEGEAEKEPEIGPEEPGAVLAPMVGTVYRAPEPGAAAFVNVGDTVSEGQTLLIIEAMKTMNPVPAPRAGKVKRILVEDGTPAEYGEVLMILE
jgi:acetyl-CoA carboxylase biotin carboxyl carrier protein